MNPYLVGITGGIGSGKSTVSKILNAMGIKVYNSDDKAKYLMENDELLLSCIKNDFGEEAYIDGKMNKNFISNNLFNDNKKLKMMNALVHPVVIKDFKNWCFKNQDQKILIKESALLFSSDSYKDLDFIIYVYANKSLRISRILNRDKFRTIDEIKKIINNQIPKEEASENADFILSNNGASFLLPKVVEILDKINSNIKTTS
tara:strand:+ start:201 stop:809 length:609 start_codon:yes stop_codon:yes gene_type:complete